MANYSEMITNAGAGGWLGGAAIPLFAPQKYQQDLAKEQKSESDALKAEIAAGEASGAYNYTRPKEFTESLNTAKMLSSQGLPAAQRQAAEQDIMRSQNFALNASTERGGGLNNIAGIQSSTGDMYRNLATMDAQQRMQNIQNLQNQQQMAAAYADKEWQYNVYDPFMRKLQSYQDLKGASIQNKMGALNSQSQLAQQGISMGLQAQSGGLMGGGQQPQQNFAFTPQNNTNFAGMGNPNAPQSGAFPATGQGTNASGGYWG